MSDEKREDSVHVSVMLREALDCLDVQPGRLYIDCTLGGAGHTRAILERGGKVLGIDRDPTAISRARAAFTGEAGLSLAQGNFAELEHLAVKYGFGKAAGVLFDFGVSSDQIDNPDRGFSFMQDGPLLMNMDPEGLSAEAWVNTATEDEMAHVFRQLGEERRSRQIARAIAAEAVREPITTTGRLAKIVEEAVGGRRGSRIHPATRVFQAIRMHINAELESITAGLEAAMRLLGSGGRLVAITFHSLEDRLVKHFLADHVGRDVSLPQGGSRWEGAEPRARWIQKKALGPSEDERSRNPRARSAKLRAIALAT